MGRNDAPFSRLYRYHSCVSHNRLFVALSPSLRTETKRVELARGRGALDQAAKVPDLGSHTACRVVRARCGPERSSLLLVHVPFLGLCCASQERSATAATAAASNRAHSVLREVACLAKRC